MSNPSMLGRSAGPEPSAASEQDASFADILSQFEQSHAHKAEEGQGRDAVVVAVSQETVFLDIGYKTEGTIPVAELRDASGAVTVKTGDKLKVSIKGRDQEG
jgi:small subunit ribosomal protein S1